MVTIEYGIDGEGRKIYPHKAKKGRTYICPHCSEELVLRQRKSKFKDDYFAHKSVEDRTPLQRSCPWYTGFGVDRKIENKTDRIYISNGGVPLYLFADGRKRIHGMQQYCMKAVFPLLSEETYEIFKREKIMVHIKEQNHISEFSAANLREYRIRSLDKWISVKFPGLCLNRISEVDRKWRWGIRGLSVENDFFHFYQDGSIRVAQHANIIVGKEYLYPTRNQKNRDIKGIRFTKRGILKLGSFNGYFESHGQDIYIYSMCVINDTLEAAAFIESKGYNLIKESDVIIPLWPPSVIQGTELLYHKNYSEAYLYHQENSKQRIYTIDDKGITSVAEKFNICRISTNNKTLLLSNYNEQHVLSSEIRYNLMKEKNNCRTTEMCDVKINYRLENENVNSGREFDANIIDNIVDKKCFIQPSIDIPLKITMGLDNYVVLSSERTVKMHSWYRNLSVDVNAFGLITAQKKYVPSESNAKKIVYNLDACVRELYHCNSTLMTFRKEYIKILQYAKKDNVQLYKILFSWYVSGMIPYAASRLLDEILEALE